MLVGVIGVFSRVLSYLNVIFNAKVNCAVVVAETVMDKAWNNLLWGDFKILTVILDKVRDPRL